MTRRYDGCRLLSKSPEILHPYIPVKYNGDSRRDSALTPDSDWINTTAYLGVNPLHSLSLEIDLLKQANWLTLLFRPL